MTTATQVQIRRGTASQADAATLASSEVVHDTTNNRLRVHDASRVGGWPIPNFSDIQKQSFGFASVSGTGNAILLTHTIPMIAWVAGLRGQFFVTAANTTSVTLQPDAISTSKPARKMKKGSIAELDPGDLPVGAKVDWTYDGTQCLLDVTDWGDSLGGDGELLAVGTGGGSSHDFSGLITSDFHNYRFIFENLIPVNGTTTFNSRVRLAGGGSYDSGSHYTAIREALSTSALTVSNLFNRTEIQIGSSVNNAAPGLSGTMDLVGAGVSQYPRFWSSVETGLNAPSQATPQRLSGVYEVNTPIDGIQFWFNSSDFTSGNIYMYGMRSAL